VLSNARPTRHPAPVCESPTSLRAARCQLDEFLRDACGGSGVGVKPAAALADKPKRAAEPATDPSIAAADAPPLKRRLSVGAQSAPLKARAVGTLEAPAAAASSTAAAAADAGGAVRRTRSSGARAL
jgi:hypothetical protein